MKKILIFASALAVFYLGVIMLGHAAQLANVADTMAPGYGQYVFWGLILALYGGPVILVAMFFSLPKPMLPPDELSGPLHDIYIDQLATRLKANPLLAEVKIETVEDLEAALGTLSESANAAIRETASAVFVSTAVLQNGRLDGLIVLATQLRLIWRIARIYYQRPSPRQLLHLYGSVSANVLIADSIQEIDFAEISAPIVTSIIPSLKGAIPGLQGLSALLVNSLANGTANAFLTLRIGIIARKYCEATSTPNKTLIRSSSTGQALTLIGDIAKEQGSRIVNQAWESLKGVAGSALETTIQTAKASAKNITDSTSDAVQVAKGRVLGSWQSISNSFSKRLPEK